MTAVTSTTDVTTGFRCERDVLADGLTTAFRAAGQKPVLSAMGGVLVTADPSGRLELGASDGEVTIRTAVPADVRVPGEVVLHKLFGDIVRSLTAGAVEINVDGSGMASVSGGRTHFSLRTYPRGDFPTLPEVTADMVSLPGTELPRSIEQVAIGASQDRGRPILMGVLLEGTGDGLRLVATDSYRLAVGDILVPNLVMPGEKALVPARALQEVARLIAQAGPESRGVEAAKDERRIAFRVDATTVTAGLIEGEFPSYQQLLPEQYPNRMEIAKDHLLDALRRVSLLARDATPVRLTLETGAVRLQALDPELGGEAEEEVDAVYVGSPMVVAFNPTYLRDGLDACTTDTVMIETVEPLKPALITQAGTRSFRYLLMPVRV